MDKDKLVKRATRKRASKLRAKALKSLPKIKGEDLAAISNRVSLEQYAKTLAHFESAPTSSLGELACHLVQEVLADTETLVSEQVPRFVSSEKQKEIDCGSGCAWCCHEPLQMSILDAISVASHLLNTGSSGERLEQYCRDLAPFDNQRHKLKESFEPCPFLDKDKRCQVYEARPVICRAFHSTDVSACQKIVESRAEDRSTPMYTRLFGFVGLRLSGARKAVKDLGLDDRPVILALAVQLLLEDFEGTLEQWLEGEPVFETAVVSVDPDRQVR